LNKKLRSIHLNGNYGGALGGSAFAKGLEGNKHLREVHLHGNAMGNEGARELMMGLMTHKGTFCWYVLADCRNIVLVLWILWVGPIQLIIRGIFDNLDHSLLPKYREDYNAGHWKQQHWFKRSIPCCRIHQKGQKCAMVESVYE
jgi:hypothetical protein